MENEVKFEGFKYNISDFYIWILVCSQKDRNMIKDLYVIVRFCYIFLCTMDTCTTSSFE
jgi:hypothetical protein